MPSSICSLFERSFWTIFHRWRTAGSSREWVLLHRCSHYTYLFNRIPFLLFYIHKCCSCRVRERILFFGHEKYITRSVHVNVKFLLYYYKFTVLVFLYCTYYPYTTLMHIFYNKTYNSIFPSPPSSYKSWMTLFWQCQSWMSSENNLIFSVKSFKTYIWHATIWVH